MGQAQINVRIRACSGTFIARTKQAALTHNVRGKELRTKATKLNAWLGIENRNFSTRPPPNSSTMSLLVVCCYYVGGSSPFHLVLQVQLIKLCKSLAKWGGWKLSNRFSPLSYPFITDEHGGLSPLILCSLDFRALTGFLVLATIIIVVFLTVLGERMAPPVWIISFKSGRFVAVGSVVCWNWVLVR